MPVRQKFLALRPFEHGHGVADDRFGCAQVVSSEQEQPQVVDIGPDADVTGREQAPPHRQGLAIERLGARQITAILQQECEVVEARRHVGMVAREESPAHLQCLAGQPFGARRIATILQQHGQVVEAARHARVVAWNKRRFIASASRNSRSDPARSPRSLRMSARLLRLSATSS